MKQPYLEKVGHDKINRAGRISNRNKAKPWRPQRQLKNGDIHPLENMKMGFNGRNVNTSGTMGDPLFGKCTTRLSIINSQKIPGRNCGARKKKNPCRLASPRDMNPHRLENQTIESLVTFRAKVHTYQIICRFFGEKKPIGEGLFDKITRHLRETKPEIMADLYRKDRDRVGSTEGMCRKGIRAQVCRDLHEMVKRAEVLMG